MFSKMDIKPTIFVLCILSFIYILSNYIKYYKDKFNQIAKPTADETKKHDEKLEKIYKTLITLMGIVAVVILAGFFMYYKKKQIEYKDSFKFHKFIFGVINCKSLTD